MTQGARTTKSENIFSHIAKKALFYVNVLNGRQNTND